MNIKNINLKKTRFFKNYFFIFVLSLFIFSCKGPDGKFKIPGGDARKSSTDPAERVRKNLEEGRGFQLNKVLSGPKGGVFDFASSNELWRASLDTIDFMPLLSVNYSGGIIVTDWYSSEESLSGESVKISIRFLTNEVRADALDIKVFNRKCNNVSNCIISQVDDELAPELKKQILKKATLYKEEAKEKNKK
ncbi:DUF3576 domain-containing protein [Candidatus Pelagibacter sp.]|nr:DUF3576 domain-containing protein [Candidatus Pelagibacter sp.]